MEDVPCEKLQAVLEGLVLYHNERENALSARRGR